MHILFIGYGKTSQRVAKQLFEQGHQISTISRSAKTDCYASHYRQDVHQLDLTMLPAIDLVYVALAPAQSDIDAYQQTYVDSVEPIVQALKTHPIQRIIVLSSTRIYGENAGEYIDDETPIMPADTQGHLLRKMELLWQAHYPTQSVIIRPTGIYGTSITRLIKLAQQTVSYPAIHWSNRIHIADLATFLAHLADLNLSEIAPSYIVSNNMPLPMHEILLWLQQQLKLPTLQLSSQQQTGKRIYATRLSQTGFEYQHPICFNDYAEMLLEHGNSS